METVSHLIVLDEDAMQAAGAQYIVAHELAHARLGHSIPFDASDSDRIEEAADALAAEWGFRRKEGA